MARFLSPAWVEAFNEALAGTTLPAPGPGAGLTAVSGRFTVAQEVSGTPEGDVVLVLLVDEGSARLERRDPAHGDGPDGLPPDVTIGLSYEDAAALSAGELSAADALNAGRIRVRGDLSVLVNAQELLAAARRGTRELTATTTY
ncbi:MAG: SCP2 sterol-binding domain-containing protein [Acidimicrobiales bacterium]